MSLISTLCVNNCSVVPRSASSQAQDLKMFDLTESDVSDTILLRIFMFLCPEYAFAGAFIICIIFFIRSTCSRSNRKSNLLTHQKARDQRTDFKAHGDKLFYGIRVLEVSTHVAAPTIGRCMADLGAEVIKVEACSGDKLRKFLTPFEKPRKFGTWFEHTNLGKYSLQLDLKSEDGKKHLSSLLQDADVLICNMRPKAISKLGLLYKDVALKYPHLVYAQLSAWGLTGEDADLAGYDIGAFWSSTGMAAMTMEKERFSFYAGGSGDLTTGQMLLGGINLALIERLSSGRGQRVDTSLMHVGIWCMTPHILEAYEARVNSDDGGDNIAGRDSKRHMNMGCECPDYNDKPNPAPVDTFYETKDNRYVAVCYKGSFLDQKNAVDELFNILGISLQRNVTPLQTNMKELVETRISSISYEKLVTLFKNAIYITLTPFASIEDRWSYLKSRMAKEVSGQERVVDNVSSIGITDIPFLPRLPYEFSCSPNHGPVSRAPFKGEHTACILRHGWLPRPQEYCSKTVNDTHKPIKLHRPLSNITVLELADIHGKHDICIPAVGMMFAEKGATVYRFESGQGDPLRSINNKVYEHFNNKKLIVKDGLNVQKLLNSGDVNIVLTDYSPLTLSRLGLDENNLAIAYPNTVLVRLDPGSGRVDMGALAAAYASTGYATLYGGFPAADIPTLPEHTLELMSSSFVFAGASAALFHSLRQRTGPKGQTVVISYERIGTWLHQGIAVLFLRNREMTCLLANKRNPVLNFPVPTLTSRRTKDGMWVQLLGVDMDRHILPLASALGVKSKMLSGVSWTLLTDILPRLCKLKLSGKIEKRKIDELEYLDLVQPLLICLNRTIMEAFEQINYDELKVRFSDNNIWYNPVRMPEQLLDYQQPYANGVFRYDGKNVYNRNDLCITSNKSIGVNVPILHTY